MGNDPGFEKSVKPLDGVFGLSTEFVGEGDDASGFALDVIDGAFGDV